MSKTPASCLLEWYGHHAADLPWRRTPMAYTTWLSEVMLQQTQIETVMPYYDRFLEKCPTIQALANLSLDEVLKLWEGLGYYSRARHLHQTARIICDQYQGVFPCDVTKLLALPGIGRYTAGAIASIACGQRVPVVDGNVMRVFTRLLDIPDDITQPAIQNKLWQIAEDLLPEDHVGDYNQAVMELGQKICTPRQPDCANCPVQAFCKAYQAGTQLERPVKKKKAAIPHYAVAAGLIYDEHGRLLIAQRPADGLLGGLWEFPGGKQESGETLPECLQRELREELAIEVEVGALFVNVKHAFTHFKITLYAFECRYLGATPPHTAPQLLGAQAFAWVTPAEFDQYSFGKADREVIKALHRRRQMLL